MDDPNADIDAMPLEQLRAEFVDLGNQLSVIDLRRRRIDKRIRAIETRATARTRLSALNEDEKDALRAELAVPSREESQAAEAERTP